MNAKDLIRSPLHEADEPAPGNPPPPGGPSRRPVRMGMPRGAGPSRRPPMPGGPGEEDFMGGPGGHPDMERMMGRGGPGGAPRGQFSPKETSQLKDVMIMMLATLANSDLDKEIGQALMAGQDLQPGQLQHIIDEVRNVQLPPDYDALLQKIFTQLKGGQ